MPVTSNRRAADQQASFLRIVRTVFGAKIDDAAMMVGDAAQGSVQAGPALGLHVLAQRRLDLALAARAEFECDAILRSSPESLAHIVAADDRSEEHTSELQSLMRSSYATFCWTQKQQH